MDNFKDRLNSFLAQNNISKSKLAELLDMHPASLSKAINETGITKKNALILKYEFNLNPDWLLNGIEPMYLPASEPAYDDPNQKELNELYKFIPDESKDRLLTVAREERVREEERQRKEEELEKQHLEDVKKMMENVEYVSELVEIPIMGKVAAGIPIMSHEDHQGTLSFDKSRISSLANVFWLRIEGLSMSGCGMYPDDAILCDKGVQPRRGDAVVAKVSDEITVKEYRQLTKDGQRMIELRPCNDDFETKTYPEHEVEIVAVVIANDWRLKRSDKRSW